MTMLKEVKKLYLSGKMSGLPDDQHLTEGLPKIEYKTDEITRLRAKQYRDQHLEERRSYNKRWVQENPEKFTQSLALRKQRAKEAGGKYLLCEWNAMNDAFGWICLRCGKPDNESKLIGDHVIPIVSGGSSDIENIQPLCSPCNAWKGKKAIDFRRLFSEQFDAALNAVATFKGLKKSPPTIEVRKRISETLKGFKHDADARANMSAGVKDSWTRRGAWASSKSGVRGVHWDDEQKRWRVSLTVNGRKVKLGRFPTIEEATSHLNEFKELLSTMQGEAA